MHEFQAGLAALWATALIFLYFYALVLLARMSVKHLYPVLTALAGLGAFLIVQLLMRTDRRPSPLLCIPLVLLTALAIAVFRRIRIIRRSKLSVVSIKECFDTLPAGLCVYFPEGLPKIVNPSMSRICRDATGAALSNATMFWQQLTESTLPCSISGGEKPIIRLPDGRAYGFARYEAALDGAPIYELIASDITEEYRLTEELEEKQARVKAINTRLKALHSELKYVIMEKEVLQIKVRIHDNLGQALLLARRWLTDPSCVNREEMFRMWKDNIRLLEQEDREEWQTPYFVNCQRAKLLGIKLVTEGTLPTEDPLIPVIDTAIAVHTMNVRRHADGDCATIRTVDTGSAYELRFTNNGKPPAKDMQPAGGLRNVARAAAEIGGSMEVSADPVFEMRLTLPKLKAHPYSPPYLTIIRNEPDCNAVPDTEKRGTPHGI